MKPLVLLIKKVKSSVQKSIVELQKGRTSIVDAHKLKTNQLYYFYFGKWNKY